MVRLTPFLVGLALLVGGGVVHGLWTDRWQPSGALAEAAARLNALPDAVDGWKAEAHDQDPDELKAAGAAACWSRTYTADATGEKVLVILLAGKAVRMVVHRPEHCYRSAGYEMNGPAVRISAPVHDAASAELWTGLFVRDEPTGPSRMRIFWSWRPGGDNPAAWSAPDNPRLAFAHCRALYKLYVIHNVGPGSTRPADNPAVALLNRLLPIIDRALRP